MNDVMTIDASGKKMGRVASSVATRLMGKDQTSYARHRHPHLRIRIINASRMDISSKKLTSKIYSRYSGYPGGLKHESMQQLALRRGYAEVLRKAIYGMLPSNTLRAQMMKQLTIEE